MAPLQLVPLISLAVFGLIAPPACLLVGGRMRLSPAPYLGILGLLIALGSISWFILVNYQPTALGALRFDLFTYFFGGILIGTSTLVALASLGFTKGDPNEAPYYGLLLLSTLGMVILAASQDLVLLYVGWELMSVPTYAKLAAFAAAFRVFIFGMGTFQVDWYSTFAILAIVTMTLGNVAALMQKSFTRLLAYSSIAQAGYLLIALAVTTPTNTLGLAGAIFHSLNYGILKTATFIAAAAIATKLPVTDLTSFNGLGKRMPQTAFGITILFLALAGVPPLNGFFSKAILFTGALNSPFSWGPYLAIAALLNSGFSMGYYGWVIKRMYLDDPADASRLPEPRSYTRILWLAVILTFAIGIYPQPWISLSQSAATSLLSIVS